MSTSLQSLITERPSGRRRPLLLDHDAYATAVIRQGAAIPWTDTPALAGHVGQVSGLLDPDVAWVDIEALYRARLGERPELVAAMGARTRAGTALRTLLGDQESSRLVVDTLQTIARTSHRRLVIAVPSPARLLLRAHEIAGTPLDEVDEDRADAASVYLAEWLGHLGELPVALVVLDARARGTEPEPVVPEVLGGYTALGNVAGHFGWSIALRSEEGIVLGADEPRVALLAESFWTGAVEAPEADALLAAIPPSAVPEQVLERLAQLA